MASAIFFNSRRINIPGAWSEIDASSLSSISPSAKGIVALVGTAEGGKPLTVETDHSDHTRAETVRTRYRSGDLRTAGLFAFEPSKDEAIPNGAQRLVAVKVNPATQSTLTLPDSLAADSVDLTSKDYGLFTSQISVLVEAGTDQGQKITIVFEDTEEVIDNVGGDAVFTVNYTPGATGWETITGQVSSTQFVAAASRTDIGKTDERTADMAGAAAITYVSSDNADTTQDVTVYGLIAGNVPAAETIRLTGTTPVVGTTLFTSVLGVRKTAATVGTVTITRAGPTTLWTLAPATLTRGLVVLTNSPCAGVLTVSIDVNAASDVLAIGVSATGALLMERFDMTNGQAVPVVGGSTFAGLTYLALGDVAIARTVTVACNAALTSHSVYTTVQKVVDRLNALDGFTAATVVSNPTTFLMTDMDFLTAANILSTTASFYANAYEFVTAVNENSNLIEAERSTGGTRQPNTFATALYLAGGVEGTVTSQEWQDALDALKKRRVNIIVPLTRDSAVHSMLFSHLRERAGRGRSEANGYVGIGTSGGAGETRANIISQIQALSTRHISAISQECQRYDPVTGEKTWYPPYMFAAIAAGMQAGGPVGEPLTHKLPNVLDVRQDSSWTVEDDAEEMIDRGLMFCEKEDNVGTRWVRSITTHLADDNVVFCEMSANESANMSVYEFRRRMELKIGGRGRANTVAALKGIASDELGRLVDDEWIFAWRALQIEQVGDVFPVSVELAPILPVNFIPITVHLVAARAAA